MDGVSLAAAVFGGFSAMSDAINLYRAYRAKGETPAVGEIVREIEESEAAAMARPSAAQRLKKVIDDADLGVIRGNIDKAKDRLRKSMGDPANDNQAKDNAVDIASSTICAELKRLKKLNGDNLPGKEYENWWQSHNCVL